LARGLTPDKFIQAPGRGWKVFNMRFLKKYRNLGIYRLVTNYTDTKGEQGYLGKSPLKYLLPTKWVADYGLK
jgi:hypothetical protein